MTSHLTSPARATPLSLVQRLLAPALALASGLFSAGAAMAQAGEPLLIGQSAGFTGGQAEYAKDVRLGIEAAFSLANAAGGINGRPLRLVAVDDGGKRDAVLANTRKLAESDKTLALIGYTWGAGTEASLETITKARIPMLSPATGNMGIRAAFNPYLFHTRAGYGDEMTRIISHVASLGLKRIALAYLDDVGPANLRSMQDALAAERLTAVAVVGLNRNATDFTPQIEALAKADAQLVVFISNAKPIAAIVKGLRERGYGGQFATSSFAGSRLAGDLKQHARGLIMIQVLPQPRKDTLQFQRDFHASLRRLAADAEPNYTMLEGFIAGRVLIEGLKRAGPAPTRASLVSGLESLGSLDLGGYLIRLSKDNHNGSRFVDLGVINGDGRLMF
jgi:ABC-type branched-subunit amino acid transport system substrate-binding protein